MKVMNQIGAGVIAAIMTVSSCDKMDGTESIDCDLLSSGLLLSNGGQVRAEINKLTKNLLPIPTSNDAIGHKENFDILIQGINSQCAGIEAELLCYACIYTLPAITELAIAVDSAGTTISRIMSLSTPDDEILDFLGVR